MALSAHWKKHIEAWQASGLSQVEYCRRHGLNANTFSGRLRDYKLQGLPRFWVRSRLPELNSVLFL